VTCQVIGPRGGLGDPFALTPNSARAMADALRHYADQAERSEA
jgi:hypothetical protein